MSKKQTTTRYRDSRTGEFITKKEADRKNPATWEKEQIRIKKGK